jgi:hypothetical protein
MQARDEYPHLYQFLGGYLNSDYVIWAPTLDGVVEVFLAEEGAAQAAAEVRADIARFRAAHADDLDAQLWHWFSDHAQEPDQSADEFLTWLDRAMSAGSTARP